MAMCGGRGSGSGCGSGSPAAFALFRSSLILSRSARRCSFCSLVSLMTDTISVLPRFFSLRLAFELFLRAIADAGTGGDEGSERRRGQRERTGGGGVREGGLYEQLR